MLTASIVEAMSRPIEKAACLPGFTYGDREFMKLEFTRIFKRSWVSIGFGHQVGAPGQVLPVSLAGQPLLMARGLDGRLRVIPAKWKLVVENFLDTYHSNYVHPQLGPMSVHIAHKKLRLSEDIIGQRSIDAAVNKPRSGAIPIIPELERSLGADDETDCGRFAPDWDFMSHQFQMRVAQALQDCAPPEPAGSLLNLGADHDPGG